MQESRVTQWMERFGWERNPFTFRIFPELMIGYEEEQSRVRDAIDSGNKLTLLLGETGAGKTNLLRRVEAEYAGDVPLFYMAKPPVTEEALLSYLRDDVLDENILSRWLRSYSLYNIHDRLDSVYGDRLVVLVDEGHEASGDVLQWLRTAMDHISSLTVVAAGLPSFEERLKEEVPTLHSRATDVVRLNSLDRDETIDLVRERIEEAGGSGTDPFTQDALLTVYRRTDGFPREVLRACNHAVIDAAKEEKSLIDTEDVEAVLDEAEDQSSPPRESSHDSNSRSREEGDEDVLRRLTAKQRTVYDAVETLDGATSSEVVEHLGVGEYKSRDHAIRSINNILRRLMEEEVVDRERRGRNYVYFVTA